MRYPIFGTALPGSTITVYEQGTLTPATAIYSAKTGGAPLPGAVVTADSSGRVVFYVDDAVYPIPSYFDISVAKTGYTTQSIPDVWSFFNAQQDATPVVLPVVSTYTMSDLILDILPRVGRLENHSGITVYGAANSIQSVIYKRLLNRKSDILATGNLFLVIPAYDYCAPLPSDFVSLAEKPSAVSAASWVTTTVWMAGTVVSYDSATKTLVLNVAAYNGSGTLASWKVAVGVRPGQPAYTLGTSVTSIAPGTGSKTFVTATDLGLVAGQNVIVSNVELPTDSEVRASLAPEPLDEDDHDDFAWWERYRYYGETFESAATKPRRYKTIGTNLFVRPKVTGPVLISGRYNAKPATLSASTDILPWNQMFTETFKEGVVWILQKGVAVPDADPVIEKLLSRDVDSILNSRVRLLPDTRRLKRGNYL